LDVWAARNEQLIHPTYGWMSDIWVGKDEPTIHLTDEWMLNVWHVRDERLIWRSDTWVASEGWVDIGHICCKGWAAQRSNRWVVGVGDMGCKNEQPIYLKGGWMLDI
jgi:hypothetical protein